MLLVEDDLTTSTMIGRMLTNRGYEVMAAGNGEVGYEQAATENPDRILLDVMMPQIGGLELLGKQKVNDDTRCLVPPGDGVVYSGSDADVAQLSR